MTTAGRTSEPTWTATTIARAIVGCPLFRGLPPEALHELAAPASLSCFDAQSAVFEEGETCRGLWILAAGRVRMQHTTADGRIQVSAFRASSSVLELGPVLDGQAHMATALALIDSSVVLVPAATFVRFVANQPMVLANVVDALCREVRQRDILGAVSATKDARGRIGCALLQLAREFGVPTGSGNVRIAYRLTRRDLAGRAGVTLETAIRVVSELQRLGVVRTDQQLIDLVDIQALRSATGCGECQLDCSAFAAQASRTGSG